MSGSERALSESRRRRQELEREVRELRARVDELRPQSLEHYRWRAEIAGMAGEDCELVQLGSVLDDALYVVERISAEIDERLERGER